VRSLVATLALVGAARAEAGPLRLGLELQAGTVVTGTQLGIGDAALTDGAGTEWTGRIALTLSPRQVAGATWRVGLGFQQWQVRDDLEVTYVPTGGPITPTTITYDLSQTLQELVLPLRIRLGRPDGAGWYLDLGADVAVRLGARQELTTDDPDASVAQPLATDRVPGTLAPEADIFEEVGTFDGSTGVAERFVPVAVGASAGIGFGWATMRPLQICLTLQQALHDQERAGSAVVRPTRVVLGLGIGF